MDGSSSCHFIATVFGSIECLAHNLVTAIDCVEISHRGLGISQITAESVGLTHLGYTVRYSDVCQGALDQVSQNDRIRLINAEVIRVNDGMEYATVFYRDEANSDQIITTDLLIMAEGGKL